ncbi:hypothetical protein DL240_09215 [Lujinxingia litoralis]|uniref:DUF3383 domain-containing protein n=1 Tax=Lujinxingia litoralis TaxID=2211119 RepID=A0A328CA61_9DELT|nr:DUF3383 family protein [Lujinxingia litoralis]RAL23055.1 hypothetical protein DL240_09215 [Lujinxingia litoralis]
MAATHDSNISIDIILDAPSPSQAGFGIPLLVAQTDVAVAPENRVMGFSSAREVDDALTQGTISAGIAYRLKSSFAQQPRPSLIKLGLKSNDPAETYADALLAIEAADNLWYGLAIDSRLEADIAEAAAFAEARTMLFVAQSSDQSLLSAGLPVAYENLAVNERTVVVYHSDDSEAADLAWLANRLAFNPDTFSAPWDCRIFGVKPYSGSPMGSGERNAAMGNHINLVLPYGPVQTFVDPGVNLAGRPIYELLTRDWFALRLEQRVAQTKINISARGQKIPLGQQGISILRPLVEAQLAEGVAAGHFIPDQTEVVFIAPTQADIDAQRIRATGRAQLAVGARTFDFTFNFQRTAIHQED